MHDSSDDEPGFAHCLKRCSEIWNKRKTLIIALFAGLIVSIAIIVGAVTGVMTSRARSAAPEALDIAGTQILLHKDSCIALLEYFGLGSHNMNRVIVFQDDVGHLAVAETRKDGQSTYRLETRIARLPKALLGTPVRLEYSGTDKGIHLFYLDSGNYIRHVIGAWDDSGMTTWQQNRLFTKGGTESHKAEKYLGSTVFRPTNASVATEVLSLVFWSGDRKNELQLLQTTGPGSKESWYQTLISSGDQREPSNIEILPFPPSSGHPGRYLTSIYQGFPAGNVQDNITVTDCGFDTVEGDLLCTEGSGNWTSKLFF